MIDGVTMMTRSPKTLEHLLSCNHIVFDDHINKDGLIVKQKSDAGYNGLDITIYPLPKESVNASNLIIFRGSIHSFYNAITKDNRQNFDLFRLSDCNRALDLLNEHLGIEPIITEIHALEYGFNIPVKIDADLYASYFIAYKNRAFEKLKASSGVLGDCFGCYFNEFEIKAYNKSATYGLANNIIRLEKKLTKMRNVFNSPITLLDVASDELWHKLYADLKSSLNDVILSDKVNTRQLTRPQREVFFKGSNPRLWTKLDRDRRCRLKKSFNGLIDKFGQYRTREYLESEIDNLALSMI